MSVLGIGAEVVVKCTDLVRRSQGLPAASDVARWFVTIGGISGTFGKNVGVGVPGAWRVSGESLDTFDDSVCVGVPGTW